MDARRTLSMIAALLSAAGLANAQQNMLHGTIDETYLSSYIRRGFDIYPDDHSAIQPGIYIDLGAAGVVEHDRSHAVFGLSTGFAMSKNLTVTPAIYCQLSMDDSVNDDDETWCGLSMSHKC